VRLGDRFVDLFIFADPTKEIPLGYFRRGIFVIGVARGDLQSHVCSDDSWVVADGFEKNQRKALLLCDAFFDASSKLHHGKFTTLNTIHCAQESLPATACAIGSIYKHS
jgi:hypothetical protein